MILHVGINLTEPTNSPIFKIHRFRVFGRESLVLLEPHMQRRNLNFQIYGDFPSERIVIRVFFNEVKQVYKTRYYHLQGLDSELVNYLVMAFLEKLKSQYTFTEDHHIKHLIPWK